MSIRSTMNNPATTNPPPYLLSSMFNTRYHQHLNHLNDMAFTHTKILQDIIDKRATEPAAVSPHGSLSSSSSSSSASSMHSQPSRKRAYPSPDETKGDSPTNKRPRKQSKPQHVTRVDKNGLEQSASSSSEDDEPMPDSHLSFQSALPPAHVPFPQHSSPLMAHLTSPISMSKFLENLHKELFSSAMQGKRMPGPVPPTFFSPTAPHPYYSQVLFNNHFPSPSFLNRFPGPSPHDPRSYSFHFSAPKKRRTKVTDTRLSPRIKSKAPHLPFDDLTDDEHSSSNPSSDHTDNDHPPKSHQQPIEFNSFQISDFPRIHS